MPYFDWLVVAVDQVMPGVVLVTGANSGVGAALCERLLEIHQTDIQLCLGCRSKTKAQEAKNELLAKFPNASIDILLVDVSDVQSVLHATKELKERFCRLDLLYLNAGIMPTEGIDWKSVVTPSLSHLKHMMTTGAHVMKQVDHETSEGLQGIFATNLFGHFVMIEELEDLMSRTSLSASRQAYSGRIIFTSSSAANASSFSIANVQHRNEFVKNMRNDPYGSSKRAVDLITQSLNAHFREKGLVSYSICPGLFMSQLTYNLLPKWIWTLIIPFLCLLRLLVHTMTISPYNAAEALIWLQSTSTRPDPTHKYCSTVSLLGSRYTHHYPIIDERNDAEALFTTLHQLACKFRDRYSKSHNH